MRLKSWNGKKVSKKKRTEMVAYVLQKLQEGSHQNTLMTGDTMIVGHCDELGTITIYDCEIRMYGHKFEEG